MINRGSLKSQKYIESLWAYGMIMPLLLGIFIFFYGGMVYSLIISFTDYNPIKGYGKFIFLDNYKKILSNTLLLKSLLNTFKYVLVSIPVLILFSVFIAILITEQKNAKISLLLKSIFFLPNITLPVALSLVWKYIFNPSFGIINNILNFLKLPEVNWFSSTFPAFMMIILFVIWQSSGYCILLLTVAVRNIPTTYLEASLIEGASPLQRSWYITIPLISPTIFFLAITTTIGIFQIFDPILIITNGGPLDSTRSIMFSIYDEVGKLKLGLASAISWVLFMVIIIITIIQSKGQKKWVHYDL